MKHLIFQNQTLLLALLGALGTLLHAIFQVTRARRLLVMVADRQTLQRSNAYKGFFEHIETSGEIK